MDVDAKRPEHRLNPDTCGQQGEGGLKIFKILRTSFMDDP